MRSLSAFVVALILSISVGSAQPLADRVPADAIAYFGWSGTDTLPASYQTSHLKAVLDNSKLRELFTEFLPLAAQKLIASDPQARQPVMIAQSMFNQLWKHPTAIYFAGIQTIDARRTVPKAGIICHAGNDAEAIHAQISGLLGNNANAKAFRDGEFVMLTIGYDLRPAGGLKDSSVFTAAMKQVQANPVLAGYVDVEKAIALGESMLSGQRQAAPLTAQVLDALGLRGLKRFACTSGFDGADWMSQSFVEAPAPRTGLLQLADAKPVSADLLKAIPADATFVATGRFDPAKFIAIIRTAAQQIGPQAQQGVEMVLGAAQMALARNIVTDIFEPLGEDWAMYCSPTASGNGLLGMVLVNRLDDPAKAQSAFTTASVNLSNWAAIAMSRAEAGMQISGRMTEIDGQKVYYIGAPIVAPAWTIKDGYLYMGLYPQAAVSGARSTARGGKSIVENEKFIALQKRLGVNNASAFSYYDLPVTAMHGSAYQQLLVLARYAGFADLFGLPLPEPFIPPLDVLQQHLSPAGSVVWVDDAGFHSKAVSPFPGSKMFSEPGMMSSGAAPIGASAMMASIMLPSLNRARETANRVKCAANLKVIGLALLMSANENRGQFPAKLSDLIKTQDITFQPFVCPSGITEIPPVVVAGGKDAIAAWVETNSDYVYMGTGKAARMGPDEILVYEKPGHHGSDGINILFGDGHVDFVSMNRAAQMIEQQAPLVR